MLSIKIAIQAFVCFNLLQAIISQEISKYCQLNSQCELESHIGCAHSTLRSSDYEIEHFKYSDRLSIINQINQFRSDVAVGNPNIRAESFSNMNKILWNYELEKLLKLSIRKMNNVQFPCVLTSPSDRISQFYFILEKSKGSFTLEATFSDLLSNIIKNAVVSHRTASNDIILAYSYLYNPETSTMGCAVGSKIKSGGSNSLKSVLVRCAFNGTKINKNSLKNHNGRQCSECSRNQMKCDEFFPGLCVPGIMKGYKGNKGVKGDRGFTGRFGYRGDVGEKGENGVTGPNGAVGSKGEVGQKGETGTKGIPGPKGDKGEPGKKIHGSYGETGDIGDNGLEGVAGRKGESGPAGPKGNYNHSKGEKGYKVIGIPGDEGNYGFRGMNGEKGSKGKPGPRGPKGKSRIITKEEVLLENCKSCPKGFPGPQGPPGIPGKEGEPYLYKQY